MDAMPDTLYSCLNMKLVSMSIDHDVELIHDPFILSQWI